MKRKNETLDVAFIVSGMPIIPLLLMSFKDPTMLGYAMVLILTSSVIYIAADRNNKRWTRDYIRRTIRERKHS